LVVDSGREPTGDPWRWVYGVDYALFVHMRRRVH
jgi:hypothetical protein